MPSAAKRSPAVGMVGRRNERATLDGLVDEIRSGQSQALLLHGTAGVGKTALLDHLAAHATDCTVLRTSGVQSEAELAFAGLHRLCGPLFAHADRIAAPQREALGVALGLSSGQPPDRFLVGLGVLGLLSEAATDRPLVVLVDDYQWLDTASAEALAFVARRLGSESIGLVIATRRVDVGLAGLPSLHVHGLSDAEARALLDAALPGPVDDRVRARVLAEAQGNPLALLELPRELAAGRLAGGFVVPTSTTGDSSIEAELEAGFARRIEALPEPARQLLAVAAADPTGDPVLVWRAAERLGHTPDDLTPAVAAGLVSFGTSVRFHHPLVRAAAYRSASHTARQEAHRVLAWATDAEADPDRRAWHSAQSVTAPDESVARDLEASAERAHARGGHAAQAAFLERSALLTQDPALRARRAAAAAGAAFQAGSFEKADELATTAEAGGLDEAGTSQVVILRARLAFVSLRGGEAPLLLADAARRLESSDPALARVIYLDALNAAMFAGRLAADGGGVADVAAAAAGAPPPHDPPLAPDLLLGALAANFVDGYENAVPLLTQVLAAFTDGSVADELRWLWLANEAALHLWEEETWDVLSERYLRLARAAGSLSELPLALSTRAYRLTFAGDIDAAASLADEMRAVAVATGAALAPYPDLLIGASRGDLGTASLADDAAREAGERGEGIGIAVAEWARALLFNGLGDYPRAMRAAQDALRHQEYPDLHYPGIANWAVAELIEAAARAGQPDVAEDALDWLARMTRSCRTNWALGIEARSRALLADDEDADALHRDATRLLARSGMRTDLARSHLVHGERLRRQRRRSEAREQLRTAANMFEAMGMDGFAKRAGRELRATGESAHRGSGPGGTGVLTAQESQIARMARDGLSNPAIAARLFLSPRTVQFHLHKVFAKLGITSRTQLEHALSGSS
ncbi:AAA family ATPase [Isoptericola sp. NPDC056134]|uniref:ATP-binding protein n=1 Tax=Isoptericola sp. NPDC056134 TaxID=3345723 RepID=UPI0035E81D50